MEFRLHHRLSKFGWSVLLNLKPISYFFGIYMACFFLSRIYWSSLDHSLIASIWEKAISILAVNLNSGRSYLITAVGKRTFDLSRIMHDSYYTRFSRNAQFGSWKKPCYAKIALVGLYCMIQLTRNSPTNAYIAQKTALRENRVMRNRVMRGLGVFTTFGLSILVPLFFLCYSLCFAVSVARPGAALHHGLLLSR